MAKCNRISCINTCKYHHIEEGSPCVRVEHTGKCKWENRKNKGERNE